MRQYLQIIAGVLLFATTASPTCDAEPARPQSELVMAAVVEKLGKDPETSSGYYAIYQLAKYRVIAICKGDYDKKEIVVDHLLVSGDELKPFHVGDKVYLTLQPSKTIQLRFNEEGFRSPSETVETFYIGRKADVAKPAQCGE